MNGLRRVPAGELGSIRRWTLDLATQSEAASIVEEVRRDGIEAVRRHAVRLGDLDGPADPYVDRPRLERALAELEPGVREALERMATRIEAFARGQLSTLSDLNMEVDGGRSGHRWAPVGVVGGYVPGGRYPLPSTALMVGVPARVAGVDELWMASPRPAPVTLAAAAIAGADGLLAVGGAQAIAALAFGAGVPPCDIVVGPGNRWVTAAKKHLFGEVGIDGLAGPSEILVLADETADPALVAADLLAQAEHDADALPILVTTSQSLADRVDTELAVQLSDLPTSDVAAAAMQNGVCVVVGTVDEAVSAARLLAPEHLALHVEDPGSVAGTVSAYGSLFVGSGSAEVFADYGVGPNHVLPTGGTARFSGGLSVFTFLKARTWSELDVSDSMVTDTAMLSRIEGLEAHARAALRRGSH